MFHIFYAILEWPGFFNTLLHYYAGTIESTNKRSFLFQISFSIFKIIVNIKLSQKYFLFFLHFSFTVMTTLAVILVFFRWFQRRPFHLEEMDVSRQKYVKLLKDFTNSNGCLYLDISVFILLKKNKMNLIIKRFNLTLSHYQKGTFDTLLCFVYFHVE